MSTYAERRVVSLTTDASGDATGYTEVLTGPIRTIRYIADGTVPFAATADLTITLEATGESVLAKTDVTASFTSSPRQATHGVDGAASLYAAAGAAVTDMIVAARDRVKIVVAQGGASKVGAFHIVVG